MTPWTRWRTLAHMASVNFRNADRVAGGKLASLLLRWADDEGLSYRRIAARLMAEYQIEVTAPTVGVWLGYAREALGGDEMDGAA